MDADAQSLMSMSLMKIQSCRTQRGGITLHRNLLLSYVLRNAQQLYIKERYQELYRRQQYEEVMAVCNEIQDLDPLDVDAEDAHGEEQARGCGEDTSPCEAARPRNPTQSAANVRAASSLLGCSPVEDCGREPEPADFRSCCMEASPGAHSDHFPGDYIRHCNKTTVLDLDTHVVTTVENGFLHQDCCCAPAPPAPARKRKVESGCCASDPEELCDFTAARKRAKREYCCFSGADFTDTSNISTLISIFGSGFSGLLSRQAELEQVCGQQALASLGAWTRAIEAF
ncbi:immediate early response gene 5-like protein [Platichthys flesus]|uniref:immediate early response gene 5-like protein n=1 Tax=Platichthys flesus TaxID=8260 RepID=UPI002DB9B42E|nr:immediate early response gene 5-like protein [Platichthys flesus]